MNQVDNSEHQESRYFHPVFPWSSRGGQNGVFPEQPSLFKLTLTAEPSKAESIEVLADSIHYLQTSAVWETGPFQCPALIFLGWIHY